MTASTDNRRAPERRIARQAFHYPERRSGFDRRRSYPVLGAIRDNDRLLIVLLIALNLLSLADWLFTLRALGAGAVEGNPLLASMMSTSPLLAVGFKTAVILGVSLAIWAGRRYRLILATCIVGLAAYVVLIAYHVGGLAGIGAL